MSEKLMVEFEIKDGSREEFLAGLQRWDSDVNMSLGFRAGDHIHYRTSLAAFVDAMETKLRRNDHKRTWKDKPVEALIRLMKLEIEEFNTAHEFFTISESRPELVDVANFAFFVWDRLSLLDQERNEREQRA